MKVTRTEIEQCTTKLRFSCFVFFFPVPQLFSIVFKHYTLKEKIIHSGYSFPIEKTEILWHSSASYYLLIEISISLVKIISLKNYHSLWTRKISDSLASIFLNSSSTRCYPYPNKVSGNFAIDLKEVRIFLLIFLLRGLHSLQPEHSQSFHHFRLTNLFLHQSQTAKLYHIQYQSKKPKQDREKEATS